jgi:hypothetical protein
LRDELGNLLVTLFDPVIGVENPYGRVPIRPNWRPIKSLLTFGRV